MATVLNTGVCYACGYSRTYRKARNYLEITESNQINPIIIVAHD